MFTTKVTEQASEILENYFNILSQTGYYNYNSVYLFIFYPLSYVLSGFVI